MIFSYDFAIVIIPGYREGAKSLIFCLGFESNGEHLVSRLSLCWFPSVSTPYTPLRGLILIYGFNYQWSEGDSYGLTGSEPKAHISSVSLYLFLGVSQALKLNMFNSKYGIFAFQILSFSSALFLSEYTSAFLIV